MPLVIENIYKSNAKPPGTSKICYGLDFIGPVVNVLLVIENIYKSNAKPPGTSKIYYGLEMTFGTKSGGRFTTENLLQLRLPGGTFQNQKYIVL